MKVVRTHDELEEALAPHRRAGSTIGLVPTMGALHEGHLALLRAARARGDVVVMTIFVNPLQFDDPSDLERYPRNEERDLALAEREGTDLVFAPSSEEMYPPDATTTVSVGPPLTTVLEGEFRPGHFDGVATVVAKLFDAVRPDLAFFGRKDAQQAAVVGRLIADLSYPIQLVVCPIVREPDGLAMSSRNVHLKGDDRAAALALSTALHEGGELYAARGDLEETEKKMWDVLTSVPGVEVDYARAVDPETFGPPKPGCRVLLAVAARVGPTRLIDNVLIERSEGDDS